MAAGYLARIREELKANYAQAAGSLIPLSSDEAVMRATIRRLEKLCWEVVERELKQSFRHGQNAGPVVPRVIADPLPRLLYLQPTQRPSRDALLDELTGKMAAALRAAPSTGIKSRGWHTCRCGARSSNTDYILPSGHQTNFLCVHYLAYHREEVPAAELEIVAAFNVDPVSPTPGEIVTPDLRSG